MRTSIIFHGLDLEGYAIVEAKNKIYTYILAYDLHDRCVIGELEDGLIFSIQIEYNPLSVLDKDVIIEWVQSKLN